MHYSETEMHYITLLTSKTKRMKKEILSRTVVDNDLLSDMEKLRVVGGQNFDPNATKNACLKFLCTNSGCNDCDDGNVDEFCLDTECHKEEIKKLAPQCGIV